jgi:HK97 family phage prohead protease
MSQPNFYVAEFRAANSNASNRVTGTAAAYGTYAKIKNNLETIEQRAFDDTLASGKDVLLLLDHNPSLLLARTSNQTLALRSDDKGLHMEAELPDTSYANDLKALLKRGDITGMSFGFRVTKDSWSMVKGMQLRTIKAVDLFEVSIVTMPAYQTGTSVSLRSLDTYEDNQPNLGRTQLLVTRHNINYKEV